MDYSFSPENNWVAWAFALFVLVGPILYLRDFNRWVSRKGPATFRQRLFAAAWAVCLVGLLLGYQAPSLS